MSNRVTRLRSPLECVVTSDFCLFCFSSSKYIEYSASCIHTKWVNRQDVNFEELNHRTHNVSCLNWFIKPVTNKYPSMTTKTTNDDERTSILKQLSRVSQVEFFFSMLFCCKSSDTRTIQWRILCHWWWFSNFLMAFLFFYFPAIFRSFDSTFFASISLFFSFSAGSLFPSIVGIHFTFFRTGDRYAIGRAD